MTTYSETNASIAENSRQTTPITKDSFDNVKCSVSNFVDPGSQNMHFKLNGHTIDMQSSTTLINNLSTGKNRYDLNLKIYESKIFDIAKNPTIKADENNTIIQRDGIIINPHTEKKPVKFNEGYPLSFVDVNERGEVLYGVEYNHNKHLIKTGKIKDDEKGEKFVEAETIIELKEIASPFYHGDRQKHFFITESGKTVVMGKEKESDSGFSFFVDGKKIEGVEPKILTLKSSKLNGNNFFINYQGIDGLEYYYKIDLGTSRTRAGESIDMVQIARKATVKVLEKNKNLGLKSQDLKDKQAIKNSETVEIISEQNSRISTLEKENAEQLEILKTINTELRRLGIKEGGGLTRWTKKDEEELQKGIKSIQELIPNNSNK